MTRPIPFVAAPNAHGLAERHEDAEYAERRHGARVHGAEPEIVCRRSGCHHGPGQSDEHGSAHTFVPEHPGRIVIEARVGCGQEGEHQQPEERTGSASHGHHLTSIVPSGGLF